MFEEMDVPQDFPERRIYDHFASARGIERPPDGWSVSDVGELPVFSHRYGIDDEHRATILLRGEHFLAAPFAIGVRVGLDHHHRAVGDVGLDFLDEVRAGVNIVRIEKRCHREMLPGVVSQFRRDDGAFPPVLGVADEKLDGRVALFERAEILRLDIRPLCQQ